MAEPPSLLISSRKQPKQARATELVAAILEAAVQVLASEGAQRFTTTRVAEKAGATREGVLRSYFVARGTRHDCVMYSLPPDDPSPGGGAP